MEEVEEESEEVVEVVEEDRVLHICDGCSFQTEELSEFLCGFAQSTAVARGHDLLSPTLPEDAAEGNPFAVVPRCVKL